MKKINVKTLGIITVILLIGFIAIYLFVPKHLTADGEVVTFKKKPTTPVAPVITGDIVSEDIVE